MANSAVPIESSAAPVSPAWFTQSSRMGWLCQCLRGQGRERGREKAAAQSQRKGEGFEAGPSPLSSQPFPLVAPLGEALLVLTCLFLPFVEGPPFAGICRDAGHRPRNSWRGGQWHRGL
jgi:hypothetical protein